jgi:hypothetical protein
MTSSLAFVDVVSLQLPGAVDGGDSRKPSSLTVSLHVVSLVLRQSVLQTGYQLAASVSTKERSPLCVSDANHSAA